MYGAERAVVEGLRTDSLYIGGTTLRVSQVLSMLLVLVCLGIMIAKLIRLKKHPVPFSPVEVVPERAESEEKENKPSRKQVRAEARAAKAKMLEKQEGKDSDDGEDSGR